MDKLNNFLNSRLKIKDFDIRIWNGKEYIENTFQYLYLLKDRNDDKDENNSNIVEFYTGIKDINNKKVFEDDIVNYVYAFKHDLLDQEIIKKMKKSKGTGFIAYSDLGYKIYNKELDTLCFLKDCIDIEIVGNINNNNYKLV